MKCATCGLPLSPKRQQVACPRCGSPVNSPAGVGAGFFAPSAHNSSNARGVQSPIAPPVQPGVRERAGFTPGSPAQLEQPPRNNRNNRLGFTIAGLCIAAGALLLVFVYILAVSGQGNNGTANGSQTTPQTILKPSPTATSIPSPTATSFPGQQYIDNAQLSSSPPPSVQVTNTFKTNQNFYVTFDLHPDGQSGVVCLVWYLNGQKANSYTIPVSKNSKSSYGIEIYGSPGSGYVDLYWANDATCSNDLLAQQVNFTVTK